MSRNRQRRQSRRNLQSLVPRHPSQTKATLKKPTTERAVTATATGDGDASVREAVATVRAVAKAVVIAAARVDVVSVRRSR
jgi:hypothetical protein